MQACLRSAALVAVLGGALAHAAPQAPMTVQHLAIPGMRSVHGVPDSPAAQRVAVWARQAGLPLAWQLVPLKRSLQDLARNAEPLCVAGLFDTPERRRYARFSLPIAQEEQQVFLASHQAAAVLRLLPNAQAAILDPGLRLLVFDGVSYGTTLDGWLAQRKAPTIRASAASARPLTMLARGHADFAISVASALQSQDRSDRADADALEAVQLPGMPPPPQRHLACSLRVPEAWLAQFDRAVRAAPLP